MNDGALQSKRRGGFTLIEALTLLFIFSVILITFYAVFSTGTYQIIESKHRLSATAVANEKMEIVRNLNYDAIGTKSLNGDGSYSYGIPAGEIVEDEEVAVNTNRFNVHTFVQYVDDAYDGKAINTTPIDAISNDYKRVKIEVSWGDGGAGHAVALVATFVPSGVEVSSGGGTLSLNVIDTAGVSISQATVHITNTSVSPSIDITTNTDSTGNLILPGAPASTQGYRISVSKSGYFGVTTYAPYPTSTFNPVDTDASVVAGAFNSKTIVMDKASDIVIVTKDAFGEDLPSIDFHVSGGWVVGNTAANPSEPVYIVDQDVNSGLDATESLSEQSSGTYTIALADARYRLLRLSDPSAMQNTFSVMDGLAKSEDMTIMDTQIPSALFLVTEAVSGDSVPVANASVHLFNTTLGYDATVTTDQYGQAYFPTALPVLVAGTYEYAVTIAGYADKTGAVDIATELKVEDVTLIAL